MSAHAFQRSNVPAQNHPQGGLARGVLLGLIPLALLLALVVAALLLTALARQLTAASGFFTQQQVSLIVLIGGLALAAVVYSVALVLTLRHVASWQPGGAQARTALLALGITALIVVLPVLLALLLPQAPAP
ncbi:MAG TPA: hypothetical protein VGT44_23600 [Ktedonobacteraceae bacterium]|nr:hypothetical protein [Ktedonobacteraceae bacterium]